MIRIEFIKKNLIEAYTDSFNAVWQQQTTNFLALEKIENILKYLEKEKPKFEIIISSLLLSENNFEAFIGAYLGIKYNICEIKSNEKFDYFERSLKGDSPETINGKIYFYIKALREQKA